MLEGGAQLGLGIFSRKNGSKKVRARKEFVRKSFVSGAFAKPKHSSKRFMFHSNLREPQTSNIVQTFLLGYQSVANDANPDASPVATL